MTSSPFSTVIDAEMTQQTPHTNEGPDYMGGHLSDSYECPTNVCLTPTS